MNLLSPHRHSRFTDTLPPHHLSFSRDPHTEAMKVALVAESFLPHANGVTNSVLRVIDYLESMGHEAIVIAPDYKDPAQAMSYRNTRVFRVPSVGWPGYPDVRLSLASVSGVSEILEDFAPDVVHLASPFTLGWTAVRAANSLAIATVAVYQTEVPSYAKRYGMAWGEAILWNRVLNIHERADVTLAPSSFAIDQLKAVGVPRVRLWPRGVDSLRFDPSRSQEEFRNEWAPHGEVIVGYVGRLAAEKQVEDLSALADVPGIRLVIVGDGPERERLATLLPHAVFTGFLSGDRLAQAYASFDIFVHCGELETFCQSIQEAQASGLPVVAPRRGGPIDLVRDGDNGYLFEPGKLTDMADAVARLAADVELRDRLGARARTLVAKRTWPVVCEGLMAYYRQALAQHGTRPARPIAASLLPMLAWRS